MPNLTEQDSRRNTRIVDWLIVIRREDIRDKQIFDNMKIILHYPTKYSVKAFFFAEDDLRKVFKTGRSLHGTVAELFWGK